jgi:hypothetical protein
VYWVSHGIVRRATTPGASVETVVSQDHAGRPMLIDNERLYYVDGSDISSVAVNGIGQLPRHIIRAKRPIGLFVDQPCLYWAEGDNTNNPVSGRVMRVPLGGGSPQTVADGQSFLRWMNRATFATDGQFLYWADINENRIMRLSR